MNSNYEKMFEQQSLLLNKLEGDVKKQYFIDFFTSSFIQALKCKRKEKNLTQKDIARLMGVKQAYISKVENLEKTPTIDTLAKYCFALSFGADEVRVLTYEIYESKQTMPNFLRIFDKNNVKWSNETQNPVCIPNTQTEALI